MQDILKLKTPGGGNPVAAKFKNITIQQLLEHTSGLNTDAYRKGEECPDCVEGSQSKQVVPSANVRRRNGQLYRKSARGE